MHKINIKTALKTQKKEAGVPDIPQTWQESIFGEEGVAYYYF